MKLTSFVVRLYGPGDVRVEEEHLDLDALESRHIAARTKFSAVSTGTELAAYRGDPPLRPTQAVYPRLVGYCNVAEVVAVGKAVTRFKPGDMILSGQSHRSAFVCPEDAVHVKIPAVLDPALASTAYLFHLGYTSLQCANLQQGQSVAVIGLGPLGLGTVACGRMMGLEVHAVSALSASLSLAQEWGGRPVSKKEAAMLTGMDAVVTTSNLWEDWRLAMQIVRISGSICVLGFPGRGQPLPDFNPLDSQWFYDKRLTIKSTGPPHSVEQLHTNLAHLLEQMAVGALDARRLISKTVAWHQLPALYREIATDRASILTSILEW